MNRQHYKYQFNDSLVAEINQKASNRNKRHRKNMKVGKGEDVSYNADGVMGEYAVAAFLWIPFFFIKDDKPRGDGGVDFIWKDIRIGVKASSAPGGEHNHLLVPKKDWNTLYRIDVLIRPQVQYPDTVYLFGWIDRADFVKRAVRPPKLNGGYAVPIKDLNTMDTFPMEEKR